MTERLALRRFRPDDLDWLAALHTDADVTRYLGGLRDRAGAEQLLNVRILQYYDQHPGLGIWMTVERATGARIGYHLLNHIQGETIIQIGYGLAKASWGQGYGTAPASSRIPRMHRTARWRSSSVKRLTGWPNARTSYSHRG